MALEAIARRRSVQLQYLNAAVALNPVSYMFEPLPMQPAKRCQQCERYSRFYSHHYFLGTMCSHCDCIYRPDNTYMWVSTDDEGSDWNYERGEEI